MDTFYEGKFGGKKQSSSLITYGTWVKYFYFKLTGIRTRYEKFYKTIFRDFDEKFSLLDLGCGGGNSYLKMNKLSFVVGVDVSFSSLKNAQSIYDEVYKALVTKLPFPSGTFDCVCSFDLIGHIQQKEKNSFFTELSRVLKSGGLSFHYIEVDCSQGYLNWAKQYPKLYDKYFIEQDGHFGLENYEAVLRRFKQNGFEIVFYQTLAKMIKPPGEFSKRFNNEYKKYDKGVKVIASLDALASRNKLLTIISAITLKPLQFLSDQVISNGHGSLLFVVAKKK